MDGWIRARARGSSQFCHDDEMDHPCAVLASRDFGVDRCCRGANNIRANCRIRFWCWFLSVRWRVWRQRVEVHETQIVIVGFARRRVLGRTDVRSLSYEGLSRSLVLNTIAGKRVTVSFIGQGKSRSEAFGRGSEATIAELAAYLGVPFDGARSN